MIKPTGPPGSPRAPVNAVAPGARASSVRGEAERTLVAIATPQATPPLPALGEHVVARVLERLPNERLLVQVKGGQFTLQLPAAQTEGPRMHSGSGDTLALQVASLSPRLSFVETRAQAAPPASGAVSVKLSEAALYVTELLRAAAPQTASAASAAAAAAFEAPTGPAMRLADPLAAALQRAESVALALRHSGLFYESHVRAWAEGRLSLDRLTNEPQARLAQALSDPSAAVRDDASAALGGLLQRQLDGLDGKPLAFSGLAWPGQRVEWRIQRDAEDQREDAPHTDDSQDGGEPAPGWTTQLHLALPRLGALGATVRVMGSHVQLRLTSDSDASAGLLHAHRERLASALKAVGLTLAALKIDPHDITETTAETPTQTR